MSLCMRLHCKKIFTLVVTVSMLLVCIFFTRPADCREKDIRAYRASGPEVDALRLAKKIHDLVNQERRKKGLGGLLWDDSLGRIAGQYSQDMVNRNFFSHFDPNGRGFSDRYGAGGYECRNQLGDTIFMGAENIAQDNLYSTVEYRNGKASYNWKTEAEIAESAVNMWMNSTGHRKNILTPYFKKQGIGIAVAVDGKVYITENFC